MVVDSAGEIGLLTTGAGLSMMLIDELRAAGLKPYNFLDVRTGGLRGDPARLVHVLNWIAAGSRIKVILVNVFAGITDLGEFSRLLVAALERAPQLKVPVVARLVGNNVEAAQQVLGGCRHSGRDGTRSSGGESQAASRGAAGMMNVRIDRATRVMIQGITGRAGRQHTRLMREYGTHIVGRRVTQGGGRRCRRRARIHRLRVRRPPPRVLQPA